MSRIQKELKEMRELDDLYDRMDSLFKKGEFEKCDLILKKIDIENEKDYILIGYLVATLPARNKLSYRNEFKAKVISFFEKKHENTEELMKGI